MGSWRGRRSHRRLVALAAALVVIGLPVMARGVTPKTVGPGPVTGFVVRGNTVEITAVQTRFQPIFYTDDLFRIWMAPDGAFTDPANTPPERDGPGRGRQPAG